MNCTRHLLQFVSVLAAAALLAACASQTTVPSSLDLDNAPDWVNQGSQALDSDGGRLLHGIGSAPPMRSASLQRTTADNRARAQLARTLSSFMHVVSQDYTASEEVPRGRNSQMSITRNIDNFTQQNVSGAHIVAHWRNPENGTVWSLVELNLKQVKHRVAQSKIMNAGLKRYFAHHAANIFDAVTQ